MLRDLFERELRYRLGDDESDDDAYFENIYFRGLLLYERSLAPDRRLRHALSVADISLAERITKAHAELEAGDASQAFQTLRSALEYPQATLNEREAFLTAMRGFSPIARAIGGAQLGDTLDRVVSEPDRPQALYDAGYALIEHALHRLAATILLRANTLAPGQPAILGELSAALEGALAYSHARQLIDASGCVGQDGFVTYLAGFHALMSGDLSRARSLIESLRPATDLELGYMVEQLHGMTRRAEILAGAGIDLGPHGLSAWHAALNGSVLLSESPHGYDEPMRGRYAFLQDSPELMRLGIERLRQVLAEVRSPERVVAAPDHASQILAQAVASCLSLPLVPFGKDVAPGLVVAWNMDAVGDQAFLKAYREHRPGDILFSHVSQWVDPFPYAPDVTTILMQSITHPYTGGALVTGPDRETSRAAPDPRSAAELAAEISSRSEQAESQTAVELPLAIVRALAGVPAEQRLGLFRTDGARTRQRAGSAVQSARFM